MMSMPKHLIEKIGLHTDAGEMATQQQIEKYFHRFIDHATEANKKYFTTRKGLKLGDSREKILSMYGTPDSKIRQNNMEILEWHFTGDILYDGKTDLKGKPYSPYQPGIVASNGVIHSELVKWIQGEVVQ